MKLLWILLLVALPMAAYASQIDSAEVDAVTDWVLIMLGVMLIVLEFIAGAYGLLAIVGLGLIIYGGMDVIMGDLALLQAVVAQPHVQGILAGSLIIIAAMVWIAVRAHKRSVKAGAETMIGAKAVVIFWDGSQGKVFIEGEVWNARSAAPLTLSQEDSVYVNAIDHLTLHISATPLEEEKTDE